MNGLKIYAITLVIGLFSLLIPNTGHSYAHYSAADIQSMVIEEANRQGLSPALALAIAKVESDFDPYALSHAGARGVMQIMPLTATQEFQTPASRLYDPQVNIRLGVSFIKHLINAYDGRVDIALSHYNGGSRVKGADGRLRIIPATRQYVTKVLDYQQTYKGQIHSFSSPRSSHYAQQIASDKVKTPNTYRLLNVAANDSADKRIAQLQKLRVHNLTRNTHSVQYRQDVGMPAHRTHPDKQSMMRANVARWESIYTK